MQSIEEQEVAYVTYLLHAMYKMVDEEKNPQAISFMDTFYKLVPHDELLEHSVEVLFNIVMDMYKLALDLRRSNTIVRIKKEGQENDASVYRYTSIFLANKNAPFLLDSVVNALVEKKLKIHTLMHPVINIDRDDDGNILKIHGPNLRSSAHKSRKGFESYIFLYIDYIDSEEKLLALKEELEEITKDVHFVVDDWQNMLMKLSAVAEHIEKVKMEFFHRQDAQYFVKKQQDAPTAEGSQEVSQDGAGLQLYTEDFDDIPEFLKWVTRDNFVLLSYQNYEIVTQGKDQQVVAVNGETFGFLRNEDSARTKSQQVIFTADKVGLFKSSRDILNISKLYYRSNVHRSATLDCIDVKRFDSDGNVVGVYRFLGLFSSMSYNISLLKIPYLRQKVDAVLAFANLDPAGHSGKALMHALETFPRDDLYQTSADDLYKVCTGIMSLLERPRLRLFMRKDHLGHFINAFVFVPRDRYNSKIHAIFGSILTESFGGKIHNFTIKLSDDDTLVRLIFILQRSAEEYNIDPNIEWVENQLLNAIRNWLDDLEREIKESWGNIEGIYLFEKYSDAFLAGYRESFTPSEALYDIIKLEQMHSDKDIDISLYHNIGDADNMARLKLYQGRKPIALSDCVPMIEQMGWRVEEEHPFMIIPFVEGDDVMRWIRVFHLVDEKNTKVNINDIKDLFKECFIKVCMSEAESDGFNQLVLRAALNYREVIMLRALAKYLRQACLPFSLEYMSATLVNNIEVVRHLANLFNVRFNPDAFDNMKKRNKQFNSVLDDLNLALNKVDNLDDDRILRHFLNLIECTERTNFYQKVDGEFKNYVSFKFNSRLIKDLPQPRPLVEIWVYSARIEGVHLRFGRVARGGLRWSDRREDFRTEVLGLVKAQQVKNTVIVPVGSKGGFYAKQLPSPSDRSAFMAEGIASYRTFLCGMLDLTDNVKANEIVHPENVICYDENDPYLVVAADKGTASFSDYANDVSNEYNFWLGDAFASGGSQGYDHKKMAITARGAWESVKRSFRELKYNIQTDPFTVTGIGDMSGDVFGNGMLLSRQIKLVAAFNHIHIFIDPTPDPETSFKERERLFNLPQSTWRDYDETLISQGGNIYDRKAKVIKLTPEIQKLIGIKTSSLSPNELINHLLRAQVDLLWFGGIGTYVKAKNETSTDVGDRANDAIRVNGEDLKCRVIGEGGNLGMTQLGRIEYSLNKGLCNTDAVDNSAGVDCSDHEVNIKVLLGLVMEDGKLGEQQRNTLLSEMTDNVANLVLKDNYLQTQSVSCSVNNVRDDLDMYGRMMRRLEKQKRLNRALEFLPSDKQIIQRAKEHAFLTRPELSVLMAYAKMGLYDDLLASDLIDDSFFETELIRYFPDLLQTVYLDKIRLHQLRREIIATVVSNSLVNRMGALFINQVMEVSDAEPALIARAYSVSREVFDARSFWTSTEALDNLVLTKVQIEIFDVVYRLLHNSSLWFIRNQSIYSHKLVDVVTMFRDGINEFAELLDIILDSDDKKVMKANVTKLTKQNIPEEFAKKVAKVPFLYGVLDIVRVVNETGHSIKDVAFVYFLIGRRLSLNWFRDVIETIPVTTYWERLSIQILMNNFVTIHYNLTRKIIEKSQEGHSAADLCQQWCDENEGHIAIFDQTVNELRNKNIEINLAMLINIEHRLEMLI